jgi:hypothetical protein
MTLRTLVRVLLGLVLGLPLFESLLFWVAHLLTAMGDDAAAAVIHYVNVAAGILWLAVLVATIVVLAFKAATEPAVSCNSSDELDE